VLVSFPEGPVAVIKPGKGEHYETCVLDFNMDIESGICSTTLNSKNKANKDRACEYCYAAYLYKNDSYRPKIIKEEVFKKISDNFPAHILRLGKNVECGSKHTRDQLYSVLKYCAKYKMRPVE
jgi:hypothetical protein